MDYPPNGTRSVTKRAVLGVWFTARTMRGFYPEHGHYGNRGETNPRESASQVTGIQLTAEEAAIFKPFHDFIAQRRAEIDASEKWFLEYILSQRKAPNGNNATPTANSPTVATQYATSADDGPSWQPTPGGSSNANTGDG